MTLENLTAPYNCFVEWGDGEKSAQITGNTAVSHTYADTKPRQVVIRGVLGGFWNATKISAGKTLVTSVDEVNSRSLVTLAHTFRGCTALTALPETIDAPNVADFSYAFYQCRSITSALPALWLSHPKAAHTSCFTSCFKSLYGQYGTGCSYREYVAAVEGQTYYQKYGTGCPAAVYHSGTSKETYMERYGNHADCPKYAKKSGTLTGTCTKCHAVRNATVEYITCTGGHVVPEVVNTNAW
ncbi:hypothetical protein [Alistipes communis]|uniref:hypothetical protein n=1 Tax=Alistipes communis TaxID=2585118 RepID=UPI003AB8ECA7